MTEPLMDGKLPDGAVVKEVQTEQTETPESPITVESVMAEAIESIEKDGGLIDDLEVPELGLTNQADDESGTEEDQVEDAQGDPAEPVPDVEAKEPGKVPEDFDPDEYEQLKQIHRFLKEDPNTALKYLEEHFRQMAGPGQAGQANTQEVEAQEFNLEDFGDFAEEDAEQLASIANKISKNIDAKYQGVIQQQQAVINRMQGILKQVDQNTQEVQIAQAYGDNWEQFASRDELMEMQRQYPQADLMTLYNQVAAPRMAAALQSGRSVGQPTPPPVTNINRPRGTTRSMARVPGGRQEVQKDISQIDSVEDAMSLALEQLGNGGPVTLG